MLSVIPIAEALGLVLEKFGSKPGRIEFVSLQQALGRFLGMDVIAQEDVPAFNRSTVDGFAVRSADLRGCSDSIPALLQKSGESIMGQALTSCWHLAPASMCQLVEQFHPTPTRPSCSSTPRTLVAISLRSTSLLPREQT